ncbi:MAG: PLP-dependent cysteine synthase family protein [Phycisphaerae bacterium]
MPAAPLLAPLASVREAVGRTPLVRAARFSPALGNDLLIKCEFMNPGGSVKDRIAFRMVEEAERRGDLKPGGTIVEATAGNTGMGLALAAARGGYRLVLVMTTKASVEKIDLMRAVGAEVIVVPKEASADSPDNFQNKARAVAAQRRAWLVDQFSNPDNIAAHYETTGPEIWEQTGGRVDVVVAGCGTGGSLSGIARYLKERKPSVRAVLADPEGSVLRSVLETGHAAEFRPHKMEGIGGATVPANAQMALFDAAVSVPDADSVAAALRLLATEGIFAGGSTGCILAAAEAYARRGHLRNQTVVALAPDGGRSYLSTVYNAQWRREHAFDAP